jgi:chromate transport protein ChrA
MLLPGPEAQQLAVYIGWLLHKTKGGLVAGTLFVLPGVVAIMALSWIYAIFGNVGAVQALFFGLKAAVLAIVLEAVIRVGKRALKNAVMVAFAVAAFLALFVFHLLRTTCASTVWLAASASSWQARTERSAMALITTWHFGLRATNSQSSLMASSCLRQSTRHSQHLGRWRSGPRPTASRDSTGST